MFYSKSTRGFYDYEIHGDNMPEDKIEISAEYHRELFEGQSAGMLITHDENGYPILVPQPEPTAEELAGIMRDYRNDLLKKSDWTQNADIPQATKDMWRPYRQALRDVPQQAGFPGNIEWPTAPQ